MPRPTQGHVIERPWADGQTVSYGAQVRAYGRYEKVTFGTNKQGWNRTRAELETERIMQQIERGTWVPPRLQPREDRLEEAMAALGVQVDETFRVFAKRWWRSKQLDLADKTFIDYSWRLGYLERFFGRYRLSEITPRLVDRFRDELAEQAHTIRLAEQRGRPVMETATDKRGRTYERRRRPLSNTSINMLITLLGQILQQAVDYELIDRNPVRVGGRSARFLKRVRPDRTFLEVDEFHALLDAAGELEAEAPANRKGLGRRAMIATLGLAGLRIGEMMDLKVAQVDLQRCRFKLADAKTEAGVREVEITLYLRDELLAYAMDRRARGLPLGPSDHFFGTATRQAPRPRPLPRPDPGPRRRARQRKPRRERPGAAAADHAALAAADVGDVLRDDRPRPEMGGGPDRTRQPEVHVLGLPAGRDPPVHRRAGRMGADAVRRRARRARAEPPDHAPPAGRCAGVLGDREGRVRP